MANIAPAVATASASGNNLLTSIVSVTITVTSSASAAASPSSTTSPGSIAAPEKCESCDEFTRANLVGVFITLILCLLTQPSGSLYFRGHGGFFWRINPIASFVEASIIFWYLGLAVWEVAVKRKDEFKRRRTWRAKAALVLRYMQRMAGALLLIRGQVDGPDKQRSGDGDEAPLLETLLGEGDHESSTGDARPSAESGEAGPVGGDSSEGGRNESEDGIELQESAPTCSGTNPGVPGPRFAPSPNTQSHQTGLVASTPAQVPLSVQNPTAGSSDGQSSALPASSSFITSGIRRRSTTNLEANPVPASPDNTSGDDESSDSGNNTTPEALRSRRRLLRSVFRSNTLTAHRESRIASVTFFSVFVIYIKIFSVSGAAWFKVAVWFSLSGWVAVQTLLILHARRAKARDQDRSMVLRFLKTIDRDLDFAAKRDEKKKGQAWLWVIMYLGMHLPFWAYVSYRMTFGWEQVSIFSSGYNTSDEEDYFLGRVARFYMSLKFGFGFFGTLGLLGCLLMEVVRLIRAVFQLELAAVGTHLIFSVLWTIGTLLFFIVWLFGALDTTTDDVNSWWDSANNAGDTVTDRPTITKASHVVLRIAWYVGYGSWNIFWILIDLFMLLFSFFYVAGIPVHDEPDHIRLGKVGTMDRLRVAAFNTLFALGIFLWYLYTYDSEGTSKWWLGEYLG
ncbi:hypothetical protein V8F06_013870 [Rhypophila decipiens]